MTIEPLTYHTVGRHNRVEDDAFFHAELAKLDRYGRAIMAKTKTGGRPDIADDVEAIYNTTPGVLVRTALQLDLIEFGSLNIPAAFAAVTR